VHWQPAQAIFGTTDLALVDWVLAALVASCVLLLDEARKFAATLWHRFKGIRPAESRPGV
jgi:Ca2+-transporting ATPase